MLGASTGVPTHDEVMRESSDGQGESELEGHSHLDLPERLPQNQNLSVLPCKTLVAPGALLWGRAFELLSGWVGFIQHLPGSWSAQPEDSRCPESTGGSHVGHSQRDPPFVPSKRLPDWASLELSPSVESCGCGLGPSPVRLG